MALKDQDLFATACRQIGNAIVRLGHTLVVVGSNSADTADFYAVDGAVQAAGGLTPDRPRIVILRPNDQRISYEQLRRQNPGLFTTRVSIDSNVDITKLVQINEADAVIISGARSFPISLGWQRPFEGSYWYPSAHSAVRPRN